MKHFTKDGEYKGETHKMDGKIHTGAKHSESSKVVSHEPGGPFTMKGSAFYGMSNQSPMYKRGLWANIHAKRKRGETMRKKGDPGAPSEKAIRDSQ
mgnify:CR=1 FL=1